jgi:hypothetical protein
MFYLCVRYVYIMWCLTHQGDFTVCKPEQWWVMFRVELLSIRNVTKPSTYAVFLVQNMFLIAVYNIKFILFLTEIVS